VLTRALPRRGIALLVALLAVVLGLATPAIAQDEQDDEGGTRSLREALDEAASKYEDARVELEESEKEELRLTVKLEELERERDDLVDDIQVVAATAYRTGRVGAMTAMINAGSPTSFLERVAAVDMIAQRDAKALERYEGLTDAIEGQQALIAEEIAEQEDRADELEEALNQAEDALFAIGGGAAGNFEPYESEDAEPAPRLEDGSLPDEGCTEDDPTTDGCVSPRMLHLYDEAQIFGFVRYTSCFRGGTFGEHPIGKACDHACSANGFGGVAAGADKEYCDRLASFAVHNATAFGIQYVIWFRQIWFPGSGWRAYGSADGTPSGDHTNHVHISVL
jgi:peptidoglycan DL-endopeptidase CwlO